MRRGMQGHVAAPCRPTQRLRSALLSYIHIAIIHIVKSAFCNSEGYSTLRFGAPYKPNASFKFSPCGTKSQTVFKRAGDVAKGEASDWMERGSSRVNRVYTWTTDCDQRHVRFKMDYNSRYWNCRGASRPHDRDPRGANSCVFITLIYAAHPDRSSRSDGHDLSETVDDGPFYDNRWSKRSDGYAQMYYKMTCSSDVQTIRGGIQSNWAVYIPSLSFLLISTCSTFNSAPPELLKSRFHRVDQ